MNFQVEKNLSRILFEEYPSTENIFGYRVQNKIKTVYRIITVYTILAFGLYLMYAVECSPVSNFMNGLTITYGYDFIHKHFGAFSALAEWLYYKALFVFAYHSFIAGNLLVYMVLHLKFYTFYINERLETLSSKSSPEFQNQQKYQSWVFEELKSCIKCHQFVRTFVIGCYFKQFSKVITL